MKNKLHLAIKKNSGRNNSGKITIYTKGGGVKRKYRLLDFYRSTPSLKINTKSEVNSFFFVLRIEKDPYRSAYIALICFSNGLLSYVIATEKMKIGIKIYNFNNTETTNKNISNLTYFQSGNSFKLNMLPSGLLINSLELYPYTGGILNRSAGVWAQIIKKYDVNYVQVKLKSGEHRLIHKDCRVILGVVSNIYNNQIKLQKAGQSRLLGIRPHVRGQAMNPVDHPHGGRTNKGTFPKTPWGLLTKGKKTRSNKRNNFIIIKRKKK